MIDKAVFLGDEAVFYRCPHFSLCLLDEFDRESFFETIGPFDYARCESTKEKLRDITWSELNDEQHISFAIRDAESDIYMGYCQYKLILTDMIDIGIELLPQFRAKGLGYQVCRVLVDEFFARSDETLLYYKVMRDNAASLGVVRKLGGRLFAEKYSLSLLYEQVEQIEENSDEDLLENRRRFSEALHAGFEKEKALLENRGIPKDLLTFVIERS